MKKTSLMSWVLFEEAYEKLKEYHEHLIWSHEEEVEEQAEVGRLLDQMEKEINK